MTCPRCQHENPGDAVFCQECGTRLEAACPSCSTPNQLGAKFCKKCGQRLSLTETAQAAPGPRFGSPESYTPKHLAEKILTSKAALEGERKQVTVLFADLKGSMELLADRDPEEARRLLDPVLERMMEAVHRYEGTVNQVMGDGIMALFGAPVAHEDHAVRACYAALRLQDAVRRYSDDLRRSEGLEVQLRVGLNSGEVVVRSIGSDLRMDYSAVGQTTHLAARMEQLAAPGSIRITGHTVELAEGQVAVKPLGPVPIKGLGEPVEVYELVGTGTGRRRLRTTERRGLSRFVGRGAELEQLRGALDKAARGQGQVVAVVGEPGVGKSRLFHEFVHSHRTHGWLVVECGSVSYGKATAYLPIIDLLKGYFRIQDRDEPREIRGEGDRPAPHAGRNAEAAAAAAACVARRPSRGSGLAGQGPARAPPGHPRGTQAAPAPREPAAATLSGRRGPALDRRRDAGGARRAVGKPSGRAHPVPGELSPGVSPRLGRQDILRPGPHRSLARGGRRRAAGRVARRRRERRIAQAAPDQPHRGQSLLSRGERPDTRRDWRPRRRPRTLPARVAARAHRGAGHSPSHRRRPDRPTPPRREEPPAVGVGHR